uniref:Uncharacterized protein n=1 Tax=Peronospora matthiolae TaxID=2874970 RepID=A0AAV1TVE5_9STRA
MNTADSTAMVAIFVAHFATDSFSMEFFVRYGNSSLIDCNWASSVELLDGTSGLHYSYSWIDLSWKQLGRVATCSNMVNVDTGLGSQQLQSLAELSTSCRAAQVEIHRVQRNNCCR